MLLIGSESLRITAEQALRCFKHKGMKDALPEIQAKAKQAEGGATGGKSPQIESVLTTRWRSADSICVLIPPNHNERSGDDGEVE